ncbi:MAG: hypothetical protein AAF789_12885, partial [Bacteroidota bacterium]
LKIKRSALNNKLNFVRFSIVSINLDIVLIISTIVKLLIFQMNKTGSHQCINFYLMKRDLLSQATASSFFKAST